MQKPAIVLKPGREKSVKNRHPWLFSGAIKEKIGKFTNGETIAVYSSQKELLAWAAWSEFSKISARIWAFEPDAIVSKNFLKTRVDRAIELRNTLIDPESGNCCRLIHAESDGIPGVIFDRYGSVGVLQCLTAGADYWRNDLIDILKEVDGIKTIYERSDADVRKLENLPIRAGLVFGEDISGSIKVKENGLKFIVDFQLGHKTGFYLDQRDNRKRLLDYVKNKSVLNCFCYTGAFSVYAKSVGAREIISVDSSADALKIAKENFVLNKLSVPDDSFVEADIFQYLRLLRDKNMKYDVIILDPPKFAPTTAQAQRAARGYKDINLLAFKLLNSGGILFTFSCSGGVSQELFQKIIASAAQDANVDAKIIGYLHQGADHPVSLNFPEGSYLKGLICSC